MTRLATFSSPAKVNLILKVLGKRPDGFHEIASLMQKISIADVMSFSLEGHGIALTSPGGAIPEGEENIAWRAAKLFMDTTGKPDGVAIGIEKNIPVAAGLGGGSSNAATTLVALNRLTGESLSKKQLMDMGASLGSDVPFFMCEKPAWAFGRGERLEEAEKVPKLWFVLCNPGVALSTAHVYGGLRIELTNQPIQYTIPRLQTVLQVVEKLENDLEAVSERLCPSIMDMKSRLMSAGALGVLMSGSGPTVFGVFESRDQAESATVQLTREQAAPFIACVSSV